MITHCVANHMRDDDPTKESEAPKSKRTAMRLGVMSTSPPFEARHPVGSRARLAMALMLYTGQRRSDVLRIGRTACAQWCAAPSTTKDEREVGNPGPSRALAILEEAPGQHLTYLTTRDGSPFSPAGFGNLFQDWCNEAGLPKGLSAHGLRKACCTRLAEAGCSEKQIAAISGHLSMSEVARYTKAADQARLARDAMVMFSSPRTAQCQTPIQSVKLASKPLKGQGEN